MTERRGTARLSAAAIVSIVLALVFAVLAPYFGGPLLAVTGAFLLWRRHGPRALNVILVALGLLVTALALFVLVGTGTGR